VVWKILVGAWAMHLLGAVWLLGRAGRNSVERRLAKIQVFLGAGMLFAFLPSAFEWSGSWAAAVPRAVGAALLVAAILEFRRPQRVAEL